ncbi:MAG: hypothetical protein C0490_05905, partial [Marivirga sp.]|nr:hypothetical protein [Marivirga sp.]
ILEYYLWHRFADCREKLIAWMNNLGLRHIYGTVGYIEGMQDFQDGGDKFVKFGHDNDDIPFILQLVENIKLISDRKNKPMRRAATSGRKIIILGYGFDSINNRRLGLSDLDAVQHKMRWSRENFICNLYTPVIPKFDFAQRREMSEKIRALALDADITYFKTSREYIKYALAKEPVADNMGYVHGE